MLKKRLITAAILIPTFIALVLWLSPPYFAMLTTLFVLLAAWEWSSLMGIQKRVFCLIYPICIFGILPLSLAIPTIYILMAAWVWWCIAFVLVWLYPRASQRWGKGFFWRSIMGIAVLLPAWRALNFIRDTDMYGAHQGPYALLFLCVLIWGADSGAYFAGKIWGKDKLAVAVSPGKTWQGLYGAFVTTLVLTGGALVLFDTYRAMWPMVILLSLVTVLFSVLGDLFESMLKRNVGLKDSGRLFPGHGGLLDRIDSLTAAAPVFALGSLLVEKIFH